MSQTPHSQITNLIEQMKAAINDPKRFEDLSNELTVLTRAYIVPTDPADDLRQYKLTATQVRLFNILKSRRGAVVTKSSIMDALYFDKPNEALDQIINVEICYLRKKLAGTGYVIKNEWGRGYMMETGPKQNDPG